MKTKPKFGVIACIMMEGSIVRLYPIIQMIPDTVSIEFRFDQIDLKEIKYFTHVLISCLSKSLASRPLILTLRPKSQGGREDMSPERQFLFWKDLPENMRVLVADETSNVFVDWGLDLVRYAQTREQLFPWSKIGCSLHDFEKTPENLPDLLKELEATEAGAFLKLVTTITDPERDVALIKALFSGRTDSRPLMAFGMGPLGEATRTDCLEWGSDGTYGYMPGYKKAAPGQLSFEELLRNPKVQIALGQ